VATGRRPTDHRGRQRAEHIGKRTPDMFPKSQNMMARACFRIRGFLVIISASGV